MMMMLAWRCQILAIWSLTIILARGTPSPPPFLIGVGSYDITGPAADANLMGYANPAQNAAGIHFRLRARTFVVAEPGEGGKRLAFVNMDACMGSHVLTLKVLERLRTRYGGLYDKNNVAISGTHTHSGPGGYLQYVLYIITSLGFIHQSFDALVSGVENSIIQAHENLRPGSILINQGELLNASINRSPSAYLNNPAEERARYDHDTDKEMKLIKFIDAQWGPVGAFNWFSVHGTSMTRDNHLISGDNKGAAARFMEDWYNRNLSSSPIQFKAPSIEDRSFSLLKVLEELYSFILSGRVQKPTKPKTPKVHRVRSLLQKVARPSFVAAFCQSNVGDTSPNILGAFCIDTGLRCDFNHSTCEGKNELCIGQGPAHPDDFRSTRIIGERQSAKAIDLFETAKEELKGKVDFRQKYVDFSNLQVNIPASGPGQEGENVTTCPASVGFGFAAGTTDGPGAFNFEQGDNQGNAFWRLVGSMLKAPSKEQIDCQKPKPILIDTGDMSIPYAWAPSVLPIQILRIGQLVILSVPAEFTTMAGRRLRDAVKQTLIAESSGEFNSSLHVTIAGLTNDYSQYVATFEEYQAQRYEGASTLFGPHTLRGYIQEFTKLAAAMAHGESVEPGPDPPDLLAKQLEFLPPVIFDSKPVGLTFGAVVKDVPLNATFQRGDVVSATFWSACPRNDLFTEDTFALVEILDVEHGVWNPAYDDDDFCLRFIWDRPSGNLSGRSQATIRWEIPDTAPSGTYRLRHFGAAKHLFGSIEHFSGMSSPFIVNQTT